VWNFGGVQKLYNNKLELVESFATVNEVMNNPINILQVFDFKVLKLSHYLFIFL